MYAMEASLDSWSPIDVVGLPVDVSGSPGVIGGGFRSTSRATINAGGWVGFTWEGPTTPQQAFIGRLQTFTAKRTRTGPRTPRFPSSTAIKAHQVSDLNIAAVAHGWRDQFSWSIHRWVSDDGQQVEGILLAPAAQGNMDTSVAPPSASPPPLVVFTHCGPAMASLATFIGAGSVCARFPLATWAERGVTVLMPNYRGSTGYGKPRLLTEPCLAEPFLTEPFLTEPFLAESVLTGTV